MNSYDRRNIMKKEWVIPFIVFLVAYLAFSYLIVNTIPDFWYAFFVAFAIAVLFYTIRFLKLENLNKQVLLPEYAQKYWDFLDGAYKNKLREAVLNSLRDKFPIQSLTHLRKNTGVLYALSLMADRNIDQVNSDLASLIADIGQEIRDSKNISLTETHVKLSYSLFKYRIMLNGRNIVEERVPKIFVVKQ